MTVFFDTSVLVAASEKSHPHYAQAIPVLRRVAEGRDKGFIGLHSIAEVYATLTRLPVQPRIHPIEAARIVTENILPHFDVVSLRKSAYVDALTEIANAGWIGAKIYDALLLRCADKSDANRIYTFNLTDFKKLAPSHLQERICAP